MTHSGQGPEQQYPAAQPLPPEVTPGGPSDAQATRYLPPVPATGPAPQPGYGYPHPHQQAAAPQPGYGYPGPGPGQGPDAQATQYMGAVPPVGPGGPGGADAQATQYLPPVPASAPAPGPDAQATQYLAPVPQQGPPQGPPPGMPQGPPPAAVPPQVPQAPQERPPLADFDNLFRSDAPPQPAPQPGYGYPHPQAAAPQQQRQQQQYGGGYQNGGYQNPPQSPHQTQQPPQQSAYQDAYDGGEPEPPRRKAPVGLIAAVVAGCAVVGLGAGALLSGGGDDDKKDTAAKDGQNAAAGSPAPAGGAKTDASGGQAADPAKTQAQALDKLLADSNSSRGAVIRSVDLIKRCDNLDQAATDLRGAAEQRRGLVTRLQALPLDQVPNNAALTAALTRAWQASASADDYYAAWADQAKDNKKVCKGGHARSTSQYVEANKKSSDATVAKREAAGLWNPLADKYQLTRREPTQL